MTDEERAGGREPEDQGGLFSDPPDKASAGPSEDTPRETPEDAPPPGEPPTSEGAAPPGTPPKRVIWPWVILGGLLALLLLVGWTKAINTDSYCARCHTTRAAAETAAHSVHSEVSCMACHRGVGVKGAAAYVPTFMREIVDQFTPIPAARGTMDAAPCQECHTTIFTTPLLEGVHPSTGCEECHGNTTHPEPPVPPEASDSPHLADWIDFHGREANRDPESCAVCHLIGSETGGTCMACHFRGGYPHPQNWIPTHGEKQMEQGPDACTLCHAPTFCEACHGTEIPHDLKTWLGRHAGVVQGSGSAQQCLLCHAPVDCTDCHLRHAVHTEQGLYLMEER